MEFIFIVYNSIEHVHFMEFQTLFLWIDKTLFLWIDKSVRKQKALFCTEWFSIQPTNNKFPRNFRFNGWKIIVSKIKRSGFNCGTRQKISWEQNNATTPFLSIEWVV